MATEEIVEAVVDISCDHLPSAVWLVAALGAGAFGAASGYYFAVKKLGRKFDEKLQEEIDDAKEFYARLNKVQDGEPMSPLDALRRYQGEEAADEILERTQAEDDLDEAMLSRAEEAARTPYASMYKGSPDAVVDSETVAQAEARDVVNVFDDSSLGRSEVRDPDRGYLITEGEFNENEPEHAQNQLTYYAGDATLADHLDVPVTDMNLVGNDNLTKFGFVSDRPNTIFVRNDLHAMDFEVTRSNGSYLKEVLSIPDEPDTVSKAEVRRKKYQRGEG